MSEIRLRKSDNKQAEPESNFDPKSVIYDEESKKITDALPVVSPAATDQQRGSYTVHKAQRHSLLSSEAPTQNYRGLYNLAGIALISMKLRLVVENMLKYGLLITMPSADYTTWLSTWPCLTAFIALSIPIMVMWYIELVACKQKVVPGAATFFQVLNIAMAFLGPLLVIQRYNANLLAGAALTLCTIQITMKMISFVHCTSDMRRFKYLKWKKAPEETRKDLHYCPPSFSHLWYFMAAPTLCYQENYPRTASIRVGFLLRRLLEMVFCGGLMIFISEQYIVPAMKNSLVHIDNHEYMRIFERVLKIAIPNTFVWLLMFYLVFHSFLNFTAELLRFGDRLFYRDFWNAPTMGNYWRNWNLPVHYWLRRHVYAPLVRRGAPGFVAQLVVFTISAAAHEVCVSVPCHTMVMRPYAFIGMMMQVPLIIITRLMYEKLKNPTYGNVVFWVSFCIFGQPLIFLLYAHNFVRTHQ